MRIYELLKMREDLRWLRMPVEELREVLFCEDKYSRFGDFRRRVIERAQSEINEITDINFTYKVEREGQSPVRVNFMIDPNEETSSEMSRVRPDSNDGPKEIGIETENGSEEEKSQDGEIRFNLYAMVLSELKQEELSEIDEEVVHEAIETGKKESKRANPERSSTVQAFETVRIALRKLRSE